MKVAIHDGRFHADEAFAIAVLKMMGPVDYTRTRDQSILDTCDMRVDVGRKNDPATGDYDHHQPGGAGVRVNTIPYAAFGLVWKQFGEQITSSKELADVIDQKLVQVIDAIDNGVDLFKSNIPGVDPFGIDKVIDNLMPGLQDDPTPFDIDAAFERAVELASNVLQSLIDKCRDQLEAAEVVRDVIKNAKDERLLIFEKYVPWDEIVIAEAPKALFVVTPRWPSSANEWTLRAINVDVNSFKNRKDLPAEWAGESDNELVAATGVKDAKFCHIARFMAIAKSKQGCLELANLALNQ